MKVTEARVNAVGCAIAVLEGTAGGYSPQEKWRAKQELIDMQQEQMEQLLAERASPALPEKP